MSCILDLGVIFALFFDEKVFWTFIFYYVVAYLQLFGYRLWGTLWRLAVAVYLAVLVNNLLMLPIEVYDNGTDHLLEEYPPIQFAIGLVLLPIVYYINKRTYQKDKHTEE